MNFLRLYDFLSKGKGIINSLEKEKKEGLELDFILGGLVRPNELAQVWPNRWAGARGRRPKAERGKPMGRRPSGAAQRASAGVAERVGRHAGRTAHGGWSAWAEGRMGRRRVALLGPPPE